MSKLLSLSSLKGIKGSDGKPFLSKADIYTITTSKYYTDDKLKSVLTNALKKSTEYDSWTELMYTLPSFNETREALDFELELLQNKTSPPIDKVPCPRCKSTNTKIIGEYTRALDEAGTTKGTCNNCGMKFHPD